MSAAGTSSQRHRMPGRHSGERRRSRRSKRNGNDNRRRPQRPRYLSSILLSAVFACALLGAAVPRLIAAAQVAEYGNLSERLGRQEIGAADLPRAIADHRAALAWFDNGADRGNLAQLYFATARIYRDDPQRRLALLEQAAESGRAALGQDPGQPFLWTQLATSLAQTQGMDAGFRGVLRQAILVAPRNKRLIFARADLGLRAWPLLDAETRALVTGQIVQAVQQHPRRLRALVPGPNHRRLVRHLLAAEDPALVRRFLYD